MGECLQTRLLDEVHPLREHLNNVQLIVSGKYREGVFPDTVCCLRLRNTWLILGLHFTVSPSLIQ